MTINPKTYVLLTFLAEDTLKDKKNNPESIKQKSANRLSQAQQQQNDGEGDSVGNDQQAISGQSDLFNVAPENTFKEPNPTAEEIQLRLEQNAG